MNTNTWTLRRRLRRYATSLDAVRLTSVVSAAELARARRGATLCREAADHLDYLAGQLLLAAMGLGGDQLERDKGAR